MINEQAYKLQAVFGQCSHIGGLGKQLIMTHIYVCMEDERQQVRLGRGLEMDGWVKQALGFGQ